MPPGVYERKPWMRNVGYPQALREQVLRERKKGKSLRVLAQKFGMDPTTISHWEAAERRAGD